MRSSFLYLLVTCLLLQSCTEAKKESTTATGAEDFYSADDFKTVEKIDAHVHVNTNKPDYVQHDFMIKYQDRLLYATDGGIEANADINKNDIHARKISDWQFFTSNDTMTSPDFDQSFKGLKLPKQVIDKIYRTNAEKWYSNQPLQEKNCSII
jgi:hypothetical protein